MASSNFGVDRCWVQVKKCSYFLQKCNTFVPRPLWRMSKLPEKHPALKREHPTLQNIKFLHFFLFLCVFVRIFMFWSAGCSFLRAEGFSCGFCVLYGGLGITKLQFFIKKIFFSIFVNQNPGFRTVSGSAIRKNAGSGSVSGSALNQCGSTTLTADLNGEKMV